MAFIIIGGGIVGLSAAWHAAKRGYDVELYEQGAIPQSASASACHNPILLPRYGASYQAQDFSSMAEQSWSQMWQETGWHHNHKAGALVLAKTSPTELAQKDIAHLPPSHRSAATMEQSGRPVTWLSQKKLAEKFPFLNLQDRAGAYEFGSAVMLDAAAFIDHLYGQIIQMGVRVYQHTPVHALHLTERQIYFGDGWYETPDMCLIATGPWFGDLIPADFLLNQDMTHQVNRCETWVLEPPLEEVFNWRQAPILIDGDIDKQKLMYVPPLGGQGLQVTPLLMPPFMTSHTEMSSAETLETAIENRLKNFAKYQQSQTIASYEIFTEDHRPTILPLSSDWPVYAITGTSGQGFMLAPLLAEIMLDMISEDQTDRLTSFEAYRS